MENDGFSSEKWKLFSVEIYQREAIMFHSAILYGLHEIYIYREREIHMTHRPKPMCLSTYIISF